jgi:hypothetical protein
MKTNTEEMIMAMQYEQDFQVVINLLDEAASRGFTSEPVKSDYSARMVQKVVFTNAECKQIHAFQGKYAKVLRAVDYPLDSFFGERESRTASLLSMLSHMLGGTDPEYVSANSKRLEDVLVSHKSQLESLELSRIEKL